jgi:hypothetical protein
LRWHPHEFYFSFALPEVGEPLTFDPWQLFRLLSFCKLAQSLESELKCVPTLKQVAQAGQRGLSYIQLIASMVAPLDIAAPPDLVKIIKQWYNRSQRFQARELILLESETRREMQTLLEDRKLRSYIKRLISPRHAEIDKAYLSRLSQILERRGIYLNLASQLQPISLHKDGIPLTLTRQQLKEILIALIEYRRQQIEQGNFSENIEGLINIIKPCLSIKEYREAQTLATPFFDETTLDQPANLPAISDLEEVRYNIQQAIEKETELLIEYFTPGKPAQKRWIEPLYLAERSDKIYLTAYCHLRKEERIFRVDRLKILDNRD